MERIENGVVESSDALPAALGDAGTVLLLAPSLNPVAGDACLSLMTRDGGRRPVVFVTVDDAAGVIERWAAAAGTTPPASSLVVEAGEGPGATDADAVPDGVTVTQVAGPGDLTSVGVAVTQNLDAWRESGRRPVCCVESLTTFLQYADLERVFRFLHVLTGKLRNVGADTHVHLDPAAHGEQTVHTLVSLCDAVVEVTDEGRLSVRTG